MLPRWTLFFRHWSLVLFGWTTLTSAYAAYKPFLVVIDPGHGGSDHGASYQLGMTSITEKEVTLSLAKQVAVELVRKGFRVALTRDTDKDVPLAERTAFANRLKADLFISLHMNSNQEHNGTWAEGIETYILNNSTDTSSRRLADLENAVLAGSIAHAQTQQADVALIVKDLLLDHNLTESKLLACSVQSRLIAATTTPQTHYRNRGVKQALFYVLLGADMPSVLVETGFLNNSRDRFIVSSDWGQRRLSQALATAIQEYRRLRASRFKSMALAKCKGIEQPLSVRQAAPLRADLNHSSALVHP